MLGIRKVHSFHSDPITTKSIQGVNADAWGGAPTAVRLRGEGSCVWHSSFGLRCHSSVRVQ